MADTAGNYITVYQYDVSDGTVLSERTVSISAGNNVIDAGTTPYGYEAVGAEKIIVFVDANGIPSENPVFFGYQKNSTVQMTGDILYGNQQIMSIGQIVKFGRYEQDGNSMNGPEEIEWIVLDADVQEGKYLLLSRYGLDCVPYHSAEVNITWENCTLRQWLNNDFLKTAFSADEQSRILLSEISNSTGQGYWDTYSGNMTWDRVFLLSYAEACRYLNVTEYYEDNLESRIVPTNYALQRGAKVYDYTASDGRAAGVWWLRSPGRKQTSAAEVYADGALTWCIVNDPLQNSGSRFAGVCVRPALWFSFSVNTQPAPTPVVTYSPQPVPSGQVVYPYDWDTQFKPGTAISGYNTERYKRLGNVGDDNYTSTYEWLITSAERGDDIPELTAYFNGETVSSVGIRNGNLKNSSEYYRYSRATRFTVMIYDYSGKIGSLLIDIPDTYTLDYQTFPLDKTYTNVTRIEFWLNEFMFDETNTTAGKYLLYLTDIQFYK